MKTPALSPDRNPLSISARRGGPMKTLSLPNTGSHRDLITPLERFMRTLSLPGNRRHLGSHSRGEGS